MLLFSHGNKDTKLLECHSSLSKELDQREAEACDEEEGKRAQQRWPDASGGELANVGLQSHRRQRDGKQECRNGSNRSFVRGRDAHEAVQSDYGYEAKHEPRHWRPR